MQKKQSVPSHYSFAVIRQHHPHVIGHMVRHEVTYERPIPLHDHDYYEIQCGCEASAMQTLNGQEDKFLCNDVFMLRPEDQHEIHVSPKQKFVYYNIAFETRRLEFIYENYHLESIKKWMDDRSWPRKVRFSPMGIAAIRNGLREMLLDTQREFAVDRFLFNFFFQLEQAKRHPYHDCPEWLQQTIARLDEPQWLKMGPRAMQKLSGYTLEYVSRILKKYANTTPRDVLNRIRMEHAATQLGMGTCDVYSLANDCGIESPSYFFRLFKKTYGCTPLQYRHNPR